MQTYRNRQILERKKQLQAEGKCRDCGMKRNRSRSLCDECMDKKIKREKTYQKMKSKFVVKSSR